SALHHLRAIQRRPLATSRLFRHRHPLPSLPRPPPRLHLHLRLRPRTSLRTSLRKSLKTSLKTSQKTLPLRPHLALRLHSNHLATVALASLDLATRRESSTALAARPSSSALAATGLLFNPWLPVPVAHLERALIWESL